MVVEDMKADARFRFLDWFAGFAAGDGWFWIYEILDKRRRNSVWQAGFGIGLRDDDRAILLEIQERLQMGRITHCPCRGNSNPQVCFRIVAHSDILRLVEIFELHPLRGKKQRDFEVWKEAVREICKGARKRRDRAIYDRQLLERLRAELVALKNYEPPGEQ